MYKELENRTINLYMSKLIDVNKIKIPFNYFKVIAVNTDGNSYSNSLINFSQEMNHIIYILEILFINILKKKKIK